MQTIRFSGRKPSPNSIEIGLETDSNAETLRFLLPTIADGQIATLQMILPDGTADVLNITDGQTVIPARIMEISGTARAWVEILADNVIAWHSDMIYMGIGELPEISERTEQQYPTALQEAISRSETAKAIAEAAAAYAAASSGQANFSLSDAGHLIVTWTDTDGQSHDTDIGEVSAYAVAVRNGFTGTEAEWEQYISTASINAAAAAADALKAEGYAVGKQDGTDVGSGSAYYHNNAKYYNENAQNAKTAAQEAAATASAAYGTDLLAADYDAETGATAGNYYIYSGDMYLCTADTTGAWDSTKFKKVTVGGQLGELKSAVDYDGSTTDGQYINYVNGAPSGDSENFHYVTVSVLPGMIVYYKSTIGTPDGRGLAFYDADGTFISGSGVRMLETPQTITAPEGARLLKATFRQSADEIILSAYNKAMADIAEAMADIAEALDDLDAAETALETSVSRNKGAIASEYDPESTYAVEDRVFRNNYLFQCISPITTPEAWNSDHWISIAYAGDMAATNRALAALPYHDVKIIDGHPVRDAGIAFEQGAFNSSGNVISANNCRSDFFRGGCYIVNPGKINHFAVAMYNSSYALKSYYAGKEAGKGTNFYKDEVLYLPLRDSGYYRLNVKCVINDTGIHIAPSTMILKLYEPAECYCYNRNYTDITYSLQWAFGNVTGSGIDSDNHYIHAELPCVGNVEVKLNAPSGKFTICKKDVNGNYSNLIDGTGTDPWTTYFFRYTSDDKDGTAYYVVVTSISETTAFTKFSHGRQDIKVYTYEDGGIRAPLPSPFYGQTVAVMGDSIVQGRFRKGTADHTNSVHSKPWPVLIAEQSNVEPADYGIGGATVYGDTWLSLYTNRNKISGYDVVLVCAGTNDYKSGNSYTTEADFKSAYGAVLDALKANNTTVYAVTPTRRVQDPATTNGGGMTLGDYAQFVRDVAGAKNVPVIDLFELTSNDAVFVANMPDGIHPNEAGQRIIADLIMNNVQS